MADDLDSFFASKKGKKKRDLRDPNALGRRLEMTVQQQEIIDMIDQQWEPRNEGEQLPVKTEDSEWIEVKEPEDVDLKELGIKELEIDDQADSDDSGKEESSDKPKTWNMSGPAPEEENAEACPPSPPPPPPPPEHKVYVAPSRRIASMNDRNKKVDVSSSVDFPSLAVADEIAKQETEKKKKLAALRETAASYSSRAQRSYGGGDHVYSQNIQRSAEEAPKQPSKPLYIPPARRHMEA